VRKILIILILEFGNVMFAGVNLETRCGGNDKMSNPYDATYRPGMLYVVKYNMRSGGCTMGSNPMYYDSARMFQENIERKGGFAQIIAWMEGKLEQKKKRKTTKRKTVKRK
jgi:hypothetical protein